MAGNNEEKPEPSESLKQALKEFQRSHPEFSDFLTLSDKPWKLVLKIELGVAGMLRLLEALKEAKVEVPKMDF